MLFFCLCGSEYLGTLNVHNQKDKEQHNVTRKISYLIGKLLPKQSADHISVTSRGCCDTQIKMITSVSTELDDQWEKAPHW